MTDTEIEMKTYEIVLGAGAVRVTFPATWKVTYGPVSAGAKAGYGGNCLRIWETDKLQRGLWTDVTSFRDLSLEVKVAAVRKFGTDEWHIDNGTWTGKRAEQVEKKWVSPEEASALPMVESIDSAQDDWGTAIIGPSMRMKTR